MRQVNKNKMAGVRVDRRKLAALRKAGVSFADLVRDAVDDALTGQRCWICGGSGRVSRSNKK